MQRSFWTLLLVGCALTGCAVSDSLLDRDALRVELASTALLDGWLDEPQETPRGPERPGPERPRPEKPGPEKPASGQSGDESSRAVVDLDRPQDHEDANWRRRSEESEIAIIQDQLRRHPSWKEQFRARRTAVTLFGQLAFVDDTSALDSGGDDPDWNDLVDPGYGIGLEMSYDLLPAVQPLIGVKANLFREDRHHIGGGNDPLIERNSDELRTVPMYVGMRLNFPLALDPSEWFDPDQAGRVAGTIPFLRAAGGAAWICGQEIHLHDKTNNLTTRTDFLRRGWSGYFEAAVGIEYRVREGFAFELSVGFEHYLDMKLDSQFEKLVPGADSESMTVFFLPRLGASLYF